MSLSIIRKVRADTLMRLDIRQLFKCGALRPATLSKLEWRGRSIYCRADKSDSEAVAPALRLVFDPHDFDAAAASVKMTQDVPILVRRFDFGGWTPFWECPGCRTRRWVLYGPLNDSFQCSSCHRLSYFSGLISKPRQAERRYAQLRQRLGADVNDYPRRRIIPSIPPPPLRPKGMSKRDYEAAERVAFRLHDQLWEYREKLVARLFR